MESEIDNENKQKLYCELFEAHDWEYISLTHGEDDDRYRYLLYRCKICKKEETVKKLRSVPYHIRGYKRHRTITPYSLRSRRLRK